MLSLVLAGAVLITLAIIIGIDDNLPGILLSYGGIALTVYGFIHHWRQLRSYVTMTVASLIGFVVFAVLHNVLEAIGVEILGTGFFLIAIFICPVIFAIGVVGILIISGRQ